jgi:hypothetical protein
LVEGLRRIWVTGQSDGIRRMQDTDLAQLERSETAQRLMAETYTGLPY